MPTKKLAEKNIRKLTRMGRAGSSLGLTLPKEIVSALGWKERQKVAVKKVKGGVLIKDWRK
jgi:antitoxin component of MazEF toxin-antitoxin module